MNRSLASRIVEGWQNPYGRAIIVLLAVYAIALGLNVKAYGVGSDQAGYWINARLLEKGLIRLNQPVIPGLDRKKVQPMTFVPVTFRLVGSDQMASVYPAGFPLALAAVAQVTGWDLAPRVTMFVAAMLGILATAWMGIEIGLPPIQAWLAALLLAANPLYTPLSLQLLSDVPALVCVTIAVTLAWKSNTRDAWALLSGIAVACSVFVRPANLVILLPVGVCLGFAWRRWLFFGLGGLPGAILWGLYNYVACGHLLETGYGNVGGFFTWSNIPAALFTYIRWLPIMLTPVGLFAVGLPWLLRSSFRPALVLLAWIFAFFGFYSAYSFTHSFFWGAGLRYLLPAFPPCFIGALMVIQRCLQTARGARMAAKLGDRGGAWAMTITIISCLACYFGAHPRKSIESMNESLAIVRWADTHIPANAVVMGENMTESLYGHDPFILMRIDYLDPEQWSEVTKVCAATHRPVYAAICYPIDLRPSEWDPASGENSNVGEYLKKQFPGNWKEMATFHDVTIWQLGMPAAVPNQT